MATRGKIQNLKFLLCSVGLLFAGCQLGAAKSQSPLLADPKAGTLEVSPGHGTQIVIVPQWHLSPRASTRKTQATLPQAQNQIAIYDQLAEWIAAGQLHSVIVEGCEGEIKDGFPATFNDWNLKDLQALSASQLEPVLTQVGLKLKARFGEKIQVLCGDDLALVQRHQMILSDLNGLFGFKARIAQLKSDPTKQKNYINGARQILKLPLSTASDGVLLALEQDLQTKLAEFEKVLEMRNAAFVKTAKSALKPTAIVIGAVHVDDLQAQLGPQDIAIFHPLGLIGDESELIRQIRVDR